jgi:hypothetical protein
MLLLAALLACDPAPTSPSEPELAPATWHADVRPIVEASCLGCHGPGGIGRVELAVEGDAPPWWGALAVAAVEDRRMPPWPAATDCHPIAHAQALSGDDIARFTAWAESDFAISDPADFVARPADPLPEPVGAPDLLLTMPRPQTPAPGGPDDYRCVIVAGPFTADTWVRASRVVPDQTTVVHHALAYLVDPEGAPAALAAVDADGGYSCFGGPLPSGAPGQAATFATWVPGAVPEVLSPGRARPIPAGSVMVLQLHYNTLGLVGPPPADNTRLELWTQPDPPEDLVVTADLSDYDFLVPAGDPHYTSSVEVAFGVNADVIAVTGHQHTRGSSLKLEAVHPDGSTSCILDIPRWDFDWQLTYSTRDDQPFRYGADDIARLTCTWDNSPENQPVLGGERVEPADLRYGEGTTDEMCIAFVSYVVPYATTLGCEPVMACHADACPPGDGACVAACWERSLSPCGACVATGVLDCGADACQGPGGALAACVAATCPDSDLTACLAGPCRSGLEAYLSCQDPNVRDGTCNPHLTDCDVVF